MAPTDDALRTAFEHLFHSGLGSSLMTVDADMVRSAADKIKETLTQQLVDAMAKDKWPDTPPQSHLESLVNDMKMLAIESLMEQGLDDDEAEETVSEFMDNHVLGGRGEDDIVDNAVDRRAEDLEYSASPTSYHGHKGGDF